MRRPDRFRFEMRLRDQFVQLLGRERHLKQVSPGLAVLIPIPLAALFLAKPRFLMGDSPIHLLPPANISKSSAPPANHPTSGMLWRNVCIGFCRRYCSAACVTGEGAPGSDAAASSVDGETVGMTSAGGIAVTIAGKGAGGMVTSGAVTTSEPTHSAGL
jgi:hypothetical protein